MFRKLERTGQFHTRYVAPWAGSVTSSRDIPSPWGSVVTPADVRHTSEIPVLSAVAASISLLSRQ